MQPCSEPRRLADAIAVTGQKLQNGEEVLMVPGRCAMLAVCVSCLVFRDTCANPNMVTDYAKLTRKMGGKQAMASSNLRPKSLDHGSPLDQ
jgi:hypothetical protein